ncbi:MAG: copper resistance protein CopC, partial [Frankia sp.]|nr:copper resistance protein CopC [Frankia sp.]
MRRASRAAAGPAPRRLRPATAWLPARRAAALLALAATAALALVVVGASPASAHAVLERADPAGGTALDAAPERVTLGFSEPVRVTGDSITVIDGSGERVDTGETRNGASAEQATVDLRPGLPAGTYIVSWRVISADGHPIAGGYAFGIGGPPAAGAVAAANAAPTGSTAVAWTSGVARLVTFAGLALLLGAGFFLLALWPAGLAQRPARLLLAAGWVAAVVGSVALLLLQGPYTLGRGLSSVFTWEPLGTTLGDRYGRLTLIRLLALLLAAPLLRASVRGAAGTAPA